MTERKGGHYLPILPEKFRIPSALKDLNQLQHPEGWLRTSAGDNFSHGKFSRDQLVAISHLLSVGYRTELVSPALIDMAKLQGTRHDSRTEETPGALPHETRWLYETDANGKQHEVPESQVKRFWRLVDAWKLAPNKEERDKMTSFTVYSTADSQSMFVSVAARYCQQLKDPQKIDEFLGQTFINKDGEERSLRDAVIGALGWITTNIDTSRQEGLGGFVEFGGSKLNKVQDWKDNATSFIHEDGKLLNFRGRIATLHIQGLTYDALMDAASLFAKTDPKNAKRWRNEAKELRKQVLETFWMPEKEYFSPVIDQDEQGNARQVTLITSDAATLLNTRIFDDLPQRLQKRYISGIMQRVTNPDELLSEGGIRCWSAQHRGLLGYTGYQGSDAVWPQETAKIVMGMKRQGLPDVSRVFANINTNIINREGHEELLYDIDGNINYDPREELPREGEPSVINAKNIPDGSQLWTVTASLMSKRNRYEEYQQQRGKVTQATQEARSNPRDTWREELDKAAVQKIGEIPLARTREEVVAGIPLTPIFRIDTQEGLRRETAVLERGSVR